MASHHYENSDNHHNQNHNNDHSTPTKEPMLSLITPAEIRSEFSHHHSTTARINNGSLGSVPASIISAQHHYQLKYLQQPYNFYFNILKPLVFKSRTLIKDLIGADHVDEVSIFDNATTASAIVFQHISWSFFENKFDKGDTVVMLHYVIRAGGEVIEVKLPFPLNYNDEIISEFRKALKKGKMNGRKIRLAVIDHITSMPSVVIPVKELVKMCREEGVDRIFVNATHSIGCTEVNVKEINADFYTSTLHKWFFCPPAVAFLYCKKSEKVLDLHHPVVSHEYGNGLALESAWIGTRDYSAQFVFPEGLEFVNRFEGGINGIGKRNHEKVVEMGEMLAKEWGTKLGSPPEMCSSMAMVGLPVCLGILSKLDAMGLGTHLRDLFGVEVPIYYRAPEEGEVNPITGYTKISHQVYNTVDDYYKFKDAVNKLVSDGFTCKILLN